MPNPTPPPPPSSEEATPTQTAQTPAEGTGEPTVTPTSTPLASTPANTAPIKIHAILLTDDQSLQRVPIVSEALPNSTEPYGDINTATIAANNLVTALNEEFYKLYSKNYWPGFTLAKVTAVYDSKYAKIATEAEAKTLLNTVQGFYGFPATPATAAGLTDHVNLFINDMNQAGVQGTTNLFGNIKGTHGAPLILSNSADATTFIHEMGHVIGVEHIAGTIPPATYRAGEADTFPYYRLRLPDGSVFGYSSMDHSNPENSMMNTWGEFIQDMDSTAQPVKRNFAGSAYLTAQTSSFVTPTYGRLFSEALRTWLIHNQVLGLDAPTTGYTGVETDSGDASAFWSWGNDVIPTLPSLLQQTTYRNAFKECVVNAIGSELASQALITVISGFDFISIGTPTGIPAGAPQKGFDDCQEKYITGNSPSILDLPLLQSPSEVQKTKSPNLATSRSSSTRAGAAVWESADNTAIHLGYRNSDGVWQQTKSFVRDKVILAAMTDPTILESSISMNAGGEALAIWNHRNGPGIETAYHGTSKEAWDAPVLISEVSSNSMVKRRPRVVINDAGMAAAIWFSKSTSESKSDTQLIYKSRSSEGVWSNALVLQQTSNLIEMPALALNKNGDVLVTWHELSSQGTFTVKGRYYSGTDNIWSVAETYSSGIRHAGFAQPALNSDGNALIYWREADTAPVSVTTSGFKELSPSAHLSVRSRTANGALGSIHQLSPNGNDAFNSAIEAPDHNIVFTDKGEGVAAWHAFDGSDYRIYVARMNTAGVWGSPIALSKSGKHAKLPNLAVTDDGTIAISWQRSDGLNSRIRASVFNPNLSEWSEPVSLSKSGGSAFWSDISFDGSQEFTVLGARYNKVPGGSYMVEAKTGKLTFGTTN